MPYAAPPSPLFCLQLQPGHKVWEHLPRAAEITVTEGSVVVHQRVLLADTWVHLPVLVRAGEQFRVAGRGWVEMEAAGAAQVCARVIPAWWHQAAVRLGLWRVRFSRAKNGPSKILQAP